MYTVQFLLLFDQLSMEFHFCSSVYVFIFYFLHSVIVILFTMGINVHCIPFGHVVWILIWFNQVFTSIQTNSTLQMKIHFYSLMPCFFLSLSLFLCLNSVDNRQILLKIIITMNGCVHWRLAFHSIACINTSVQFRLLFCLIFAEFSFPNFVVRILFHKFRTLISSQLSAQSG